MRITKISVDNVPPVKKFHVDSLSDLVVIAGANGAGKTRLVSHILLAFQKPALSNIQFSIECTNEEELEQFGKQVIDSTDRDQRSKLQTMLQQNRQRRNFKSGILYFESDRSIAPVQPLAFSFEFADPYTESIGWNVPMQPLKNRWQDTQHAIFKKILTLRNQLGSRAMQLGREGRDQMGLGFDDPIQPFMDAFSMLLAPKRLVQPDLQQQKLMYEENGEKRPIDTLSSGEREVLNVAFDFILRKPTDCIVFFDEPELHLHPELLGRLIRTLQSSGKRNQFFLISHSPEVIASSLDDTVIFLTKPKEDGSNQATILKPDGETTGALLALGQSVGIVALGKKIVLIEGTKSSLDAKVYSAISRQKFPNLALVPSDGKADLENFDRLNEKILSRTLWGVEFFLLADRDCAIGANGESERFRLLPRYHLENYFLDGEILAECFLIQEPDESWLRDPMRIEARLHEIATAKTSYAASLIASASLRQRAGNVSVKPNGVHDMDKAQLLQAVQEKTDEEKARLTEILQPAEVAEQFERAYSQVERMLAEGEEWKKEIPAKQVFSQFCAEAKIQPGRLKNLYINVALEKKPDTFKDIVDILESFSSISSA